MEDEDLFEETNEGVYTPPRKSIVLGDIPLVTKYDSLFFVVGLTPVSSLDADDA